MAERKTLTITEVGQITKVGEKQIPKLSFKAKDGAGEFSYSTFRSSLFDAIKEGATIEADVEVKQDGDWINRRIVQVYVNGQPIGGQKQGFRGKSPEELDQQAKMMCLAYAKDLAVADRIENDQITYWADGFYEWFKNGKPKDELKTESHEETSSGSVDLKSLKFKNAGEFYTACLKQLKLSKTRVDAEIPEYDLSKADQREKAWQQIVAIYGQKP